MIHYLEELKIHIKNLKTGELYPETLEQTTGSVTWANDNKTLFYVKQDLKTLRSFQIYAHQLGTSQRRCVGCEETGDETFYCSVYKSKSENYVIINSSSTLSDEYRMINADEPQNTPVLFQERERGLEYSTVIIMDFTSLPIKIMKTFPSNFVMKTKLTRKTGKL